MKIDLNADLGEGMDDSAILPCLSSANVACGMHAGGPDEMERTVAAALKQGVHVGAHPGYADKANFGRLDVVLSDEQVRSLVLYQIGALDGFLRAHGGTLSHVKAHGALYNRAAKDASLARAIAESVRSYRRALVLVGLAGSLQGPAAAAAGLRFAGEAFADRRYLPDGTLVPRSQPGAVLHDPSEVAEQALRIASEHIVIASDGSRCSVQAETLCLHGDTPGAVANARAVRSHLEAAGIQIAPL